MIDETITELVPLVGVKAACAAVGVAAGGSGVAVGGSAPWPI